MTSLSKYIVIRLAAPTADGNGLSEQSFDVFELFVLRLRQTDEEHQKTDDCKAAVEVESTCNTRST